MLLFHINSFNSFSVLTSFSLAKVRRARFILAYSHADLYVESKFYVKCECFGGLYVEWPND